MLQTNQLQKIAWIVLFSGSALAFAQRPRVELPEFEKSTEDVFFPDVFEVLQGERPVSSTVKAPGPATPEEKPSSGEPWSELVSATTIVDEIKALKISVDGSITTPSEFASRGHTAVRRDFSLLAVLFAIVDGYDGEIRFQHSAALAKARFARAAANAKAGGSPAVYKEARLRKLDLQDLVGGGRLTGDAEPADAAWDQVANRSALMQRLEVAAQGRLGPATRDAAALGKNLEQVVHESELVAALAHVLTRPGMEDGEDEDYAAFVEAMRSAASEVAEGAKREDIDAVRSSLGRVTKACADCHESYR